MFYESRLATKLNRGTKVSVNQGGHVTTWLEKKIIYLAKYIIGTCSKFSRNNRLTQPIVDDCRNMLQFFQEYHMQYFFRETNKVADLLAKLGRGQSESFISCVTLPFVVMEALSFDCISAPCTRLIRAPIAFD